ncbi:hypothetical protein E4U17_007882 [Claviceps sp. LM77 group G4]|nr:hypothetical protein E4U17_007882 [Claviceps sp. LM77 group G4]KAG6072514.1 hypothetical protein E4U16_005291 [Claviceps sp. LM84 group G4]KAG6085961.1 hypothetical protein E4U33_000474 [Claviceps sp. LM78 group G4]
MERRTASVGDTGQVDAPSGSPLRRRYSMEEDLYYKHVLATPQSHLPQPPIYGPSTNNDVDVDEGEDEGRRSNAGQLEEEAKFSSILEPLPDYESSVHLEGVFSKKHEIENTTKRAANRQWDTVFVSLNGTALNVYSVKKGRCWGRNKDDTTICPDNPSGVRKAKLQKRYSLLHADAGIAADYSKRRYVIRIRAETDQFLLACIELTTFVRWLECLFSAIDVAAPIDDREFPRDMSIPRVQRIRWIQSQASHRNEESESSATSLVNYGSSIDGSRPASVSESTWQETTARSSPPRTRLMTRRRLSASSYLNPSVDPHTGKWFPEHEWSSAHDLLYAKLCYSNLLFRSPRKSNYIISKGKQWFVDWRTGKMARVLPPTYGEIDLFGPWEGIETKTPRT